MSGDDVGMLRLLVTPVVSWTVSVMVEVPGASGGGHVVPDMSWWT